MKDFEISSSMGIKKNRIFFKIINNFYYKPNQILFILQKEEQIILSTK